MVKHLVRDALPSLALSNAGVKQQLHDFIQKRIRRADNVDVEMLTALLLSDTPGEHAVAQLVNELTASSLQSAEQLLRVGAFFDIPSRDITTDPRELQAVFARRNQMAHEMDIDFTPRNRNRRQRRRGDTVRDVNAIFAVARLFIERVDEKLATGQ